jgi:hypothetical protein
VLKSHSWPSALDQGVRPRGLAETGRRPATHAGPSASSAWGPGCDEFTAIVDDANREEAALVLLRLDDAFRGSLSSPSEGLIAMMRIWHEHPTSVGEVAETLMGWLPVPVPSVASTVIWSSNSLPGADSHC